MQRLVGGSDASSERFPYMGVFQGPTVGFPEDSLVNPVCSGVLIAPNMVLTSAGCASAIQEDQDARHFGGICTLFGFCIFFGPGGPGLPGPPGPPGPPGGSPVEPPVVEPPVVSPEVSPVVDPEVAPAAPPVVAPADSPVVSPEVDPAESPVVSPEVAPVGAPVELPPSVTQFKMGCADGRTGCTDLNIAEVRIFSLGTDDLVGIVLLTEDVEDIAPIKLATHDLHATGQTVTALGWGDTFDAKREGNTRFPALSLQATDLLLLNSDDCQARLTQLDGFFGGNVVAGENDVCTLSDDPAVLKNVCVGDDAAPLIYACSDDPAEDSLLGFGLGTQACGIPGLPAVFKRTNFADLETFLTDLVGAGTFVSETALPECLVADVEVPDFTTDLDQWTCEPASFGNLLACDCGCGLSDPDCKFIIGCEGQNCVNDECTDDGVDTALPDPTGESGPGGVPAQDPGTSVDNAPSTDEETNPGADGDGEGALGLNDQTLALVMLALVATTVLMLCLITALLILDRNKTQNNDQQAAVMLSETNAGNSFEEGGSTSKAQGMSGEEAGFSGGEEAGFSGGEEAGFSDEAGLSNDEEAGISASGAGVSASGAGVSASGAGASGSAGADEAGLSDAAGFSEEDGDEDGFSEEEDEGSKHI